MRIFALVGLLAVAVVSPVGAQNLGLWQERVGEGITYGEPAKAVAIAPADPVRALPIAPRPAAHAALRLAPVAVTAKPVENAEPAAVRSLGPVGNFLARGYDADVPMPHPDLQGWQRPERRFTGPHPYARGGEGGATFGLSVPLPADRASAVSRNTRSGSATPSPEARF